MNFKSEHVNTLVLDNGHSKRCYIIDIRHDCIRRQFSFYVKLKLKQNRTIRTACDRWIQANSAYNYNRLKLI